MVGEKKMGVDVYKEICEKFLLEEGEEYVFARAFVTLQWNLMARCIIHWNVDCLIFCFVKSKGDQMGKNHYQEWHVNAPSHPFSLPHSCSGMLHLCQSWHFFNEHG